MKKKVMSQQNAFCIFWRSAYLQVTHRSHSLSGTILACVAQHFPYFLVDVRKRVLSDGSTKQMPAKDKENKRNDAKEGRSVVGKRVFYDTLPRRPSIPTANDVISPTTWCHSSWSGDSRGCARSLNTRARAAPVEGAEERCIASHVFSGWGRWRRGTAGVNARQDNCGTAGSGLEPIRGEVYFGSGFSDCVYKFSVLCKGL